MRRFTVSATALVFALTVGVATSATAATAATSATAATPAPPSKTQPVALDVQTPYEPQVSCDPRTKPGVTAFAALMKAHYNTGVAGTNRTCLGDTSEHYDGRALDWMLSVNNPSQKAIADSVTAWLSANNGAMARRFGLSYIIWNHKMWREYRPEQGWATYTGAVPHTDHIHFSFSWDGAMKRTSWWTGTATTVVDVGPCRVYAGQFAPLYRAIRTAPCPGNLPAAPASVYPVYVFGQTNLQIAVAQRVLGVTADGQFGSATFSALVAWQTSAGVPVTGVLDKATWARLVPNSGQPPVPAPAPSPPPAPVPPPATPTAAPWAATRYTPYKGVVLRQGSRGVAVVALQRGLKVAADGSFGPRTRAALVAFQRQQHLSTNGLAGRLVWDRLEKRDYPLIAYRRLTLRQGSTGAVVVLTQRALRVSADGDFGSKTAAAVKAVQRSAKVAQTGVVSGWTWVAIESRMSR